VAPGGGAPSASALSAGVWADKSFTSASDVHWYSFNAAEGGSYRVQANDSNDGNNMKTAAVYLSVYTAGGKPLAANRSYTYTSNPLTISGVSGKVYIKATPYYGGVDAQGAYSLRYYPE
jgi:hypothetical protein